MPQVKVYQHEITSANTLCVEVGTNCPQGGDSGHGGQTVLRLLDYSRKAMAASINYSVQFDAQKIEIIFAGDGEHQALIEGLEFALQVLRGQTQGLAVMRTEEIDILRYGLTDTKASLAEASAVEPVGVSSLMNQAAGHHEKSDGRIESREVIDKLSAKPVQVRHKAILITINQLYRSDMTAEELYEATRGIWRVGARREQAEYGMAVYKGIVREVYRIQKWHPAGTLQYRTRDAKDFKSSGRWEFEGVVATDIRVEYVGNSVGMGGQNPIRYKNT